MPHERELQAALEAAKRATSVLLTEYERFEVISDAPADITTAADRLSQETILKFLCEQFPEDGICAEEDTSTKAAAKSSADRMWVVDPIDGTRGFARKNGEFSVMIGFVEGGETKVGVVAQPAARRTTYAVRGGGCWRIDGEQTVPEECSVRSVQNLSDSTLTQSHPKSLGEPTKPVKVLGPRQVVPTYSAGIKLALVARGEADLYLNTYPRFHDWDICAGHILVEEAGGKVTGLGGEKIEYGSPGAFQTNGLLASNGELHGLAIDAWAEAYKKGEA
ncbi:MAG: 3'(2'),5'-bisphosphate nucleotidase CysQ [Gemmataceae bacterium]